MVAKTAADQGPKVVIIEKRKVFMVTDDLGSYADFDVVRVKNGKKEEITQPVATEVPCTIVVSGSEVATIMCTPTYLREFATGYLYTSGMLNSANEVTEFYCDTTRWRLDVETTRKIVGTEIFKNISIPIFRYIGIIPRVPGRNIHVIQNITDMAGNNIFIVFS